MPAFLGNSSFPYFTLTDGSAIRLTYRQADGEVGERAVAQKRGHVLRGGSCLREAAHRAYLLQGCLAVFAGEGSFELSSVVGSLKNGDAGVTIRGVVMAVCAQGYMLADKTGAIFVYMGSKFDTTTVAVGDQSLAAG